MGLADAVGTDAGATITSVAATGKEVFAAAGNKVIKYIRGKQAGVYEASAEIGKMMLFGDQVVALSADGSRLSVWNAKTFSELRSHASSSKVDRAADSSRARK